MTIRHSEQKGNTMADNRRLAEEYSDNLLGVTHAILDLADAIRETAQSQTPVALPESWTKWGEAGRGRS